MLHEQFWSIKTLTRLVSNHWAWYSHPAAPHWIQWAMDAHWRQSPNPLEKEKKRYQQSDAYFLLLASQQPLLWTDGGNFHDILREEITKIVTTFELKFLQY